MPISFPSSPSLNQQYTFASRTWIWNGASWQSLGTAQGLTGAQGTQGVQGPQGLTGNNGFLAQISAPGANDVLWLDTDEPAIPVLNTSVVTTKGDLIVATASGTITRLGAGSSGQYLGVNTGATTGLEWQTPSTAADGDQIVLSTQVFR